MNFYAELDTSFEIKEENDHSGVYNQNVGIHGGIDLLRFETKKERDIYVSNTNKCNAISEVNARLNHKESWLFKLKNNTQTVTFKEALNIF